MAILKRIMSAVHELTKPALTFTWRDFPDPERSTKRIHTCAVPGGGDLIAQEVSAPEPGVGHWGWQLLNEDGEVVEMRNGFYDEQATKAHAEAHFRANYTDSGDSV